MGLARQRIIGWATDFTAEEQSAMLELANRIGDTNNLNSGQRDGDRDAAMLASLRSMLRQEADPQKMVTMVSPLTKKHPIPMKTPHGIAYNGW